MTTIKSETFEMWAAEGAENTSTLLQGAENTAHCEGN